MGYIFRTFWILSFLLMGLQSLVSQTIIYVKQNAAGNGTSWDNAFGNLQSALSQATSGDQIWVAEGIYYPINCSFCTVDNRSKSFEIPSGVKLYGGFAGNETNIDMRSPGHVSVLDGDIDKNNAKTNNSFNIVYIKDASNETLVDGFTIRNGYAERNNVAAGSYSNSGAGIYIEKIRKDEPTGPTISNCIFTKNEVFGIGAGVFIDSDEGWMEVRIENCSFFENIAQNGGPAVHSKSDFGGIVKTHLLNCSFVDNEATERGGAVYNLSFRGTNDMIIRDCLFRGNTSAKESGALGLDIEQGQGSIDIDRSTFVANQATDGGAIFIDTKNGETDLKIWNARFDSNTVQFNGGALNIHAIDSGVVEFDLAYSSFDRNTASGNGGAMHIDATAGKSFQQRFLGVKFNYNKASSNGGALFWKADEGLLNGDLLNVSFAKNDAFSGGGIYATASMQGDVSHNLINCTFFANKGFNGGALFLTTADGQGNADLSIVNSVFRANTGFLGSAISRLTHAFPSIENSVLDVSDCDAAFSVPSGAQGNITCNNLIFEAVDFVDETLLDLRPTSDTAIDAAINLALDTFEIESDADSTYRFDNLIADLGAFESSSGNIHDVQWDVVPDNVSSCDLVDTRLRFVARGNGHFDYQWMRNGNPVANTKTRILDVAGGQEVAGVYQLQVTDVNDNVFISDSILITVTPPTAFSVSATADKTALCQLDSLRFSVQLEGPAVAYNEGWYRNDTLVATERTYFAKDIQQGDRFQYIASSDFECLTNDSDSSVVFEPTVEIPKLPIVAIKEPGRICEGTPKTLGVTASFGGSNPIFTWYRNGLRQVGTSSQKQFSNLRSTDELYVTMQSDEACISDTLVLSDTLRPNVISRIIPTVSIQTEDSLICKNQRSNFFASVINAGETPTVMWYANQSLIAENVLDISYLDFEDGDSVYIEVFPDGDCADDTPFRSNVITMEVRSVDAPSLELEVDKESLCVGAAVQARIITQNLPTSYDLVWKLNNEVFLQDSLQTTLDNISNGDRLLAELQFSSICAPDGFFSSNSITFEVLDSNATSLSIGASSNPLCSGEAVQLTASFSDGTRPERVVWKQNGVIIPEHTSATVLIRDLQNGDKMVAEASAPSLCAAEGTLVSNEILFSISSSVMPEISIEGEDFSICRKDDFFLVAKTVNLGINKRVDWYVNGVKRSSGDTLFFKGISGDADVYAIGFPSISCPTVDSVISAPIRITALDNIEASAAIYLDARQYCEEGIKKLKLEVTGENGGSNPSFKWYLNDKFTFITSDIFRLGNFIPSDVVFVEMTSNNACVDPSKRKVFSDTLSISDIDCELVLPNENLEESTIKVYPNPSAGEVFVALPRLFKQVNLSVFDVAGSLQHQQKLQKIDFHTLDISHLRAGIYYLRIQTETSISVVKLVKINN